jgi:hypothetical protein
MNVQRVEVGAQADCPFPEPQRSTPTTPVFARPVCTSRPNARSFSATNSDVALSSNAVSGCAWMWCRQLFISGTSAAMSATVFIATPLRICTFDTRSGDGNATPDAAPNERRLLR